MNWQLIGASTIGSHHRNELVPHNGQDALYYDYDPMSGTGIAVVADGCGSCTHSEVGAQIGVRLLANTWSKQGRKPIGYRNFFGHVVPRAQDFVKIVIEPLLSDLRRTLTPLGDINAKDQLKDAIARYGLFTLNGVIFNHKVMVFFCIGDGITIVNNQTTVIEPPSHDDPELNNAPQYIGYSVYDQLIPIDLCYFRVWPTNEVKSFLIASDGFAPLLIAKERLIPGQQISVGPVDQLWIDDKYFQGNPPQKAQRWLNLVSQTKKRLKRGSDGPLADIEIFPSLVDDDTTFIVGRQIDNPNSNKKE